MTTRKKQPAVKQTVFKNETGVIKPEIDLPKPEPGEGRAPPEEQTLLPHERDQTTTLSGTSQENENEMSRDVIVQAGKDVQRGLEDTERRGIPSNVPKGTRKKR